MFLEQYKPKVIDLTATKDRVKLRIGEPGSAGRYWFNMTFDNMKEMEDFAEQVNFAVKRGPQEYRPGS